MGLLSWASTFFGRAANGGLFSAIPDGHDTGITVTPENAMSVSALWSAVQLISDAYACLPLIVKDDKKKKIIDHPIASLLNTSGSANPFMSSVMARQTMMVNQLLYGNAYAMIERDPAGSPVALYPVPSRNTSVLQSGSSGELTYITTFANKTFNLTSSQMLHIPGPISFDGLIGVSPIIFHRQTVGLSLALEKFAAKFFGQGGNIGGIIETGAMKPAAAKDFLETWKATYTGPDSAWKIAALTGGMKFHQTTGKPNESQALESRVHQVREVARIYRVPPHMLGDLEKASYASAEQNYMEFYQGTMQPYIIRWEAEISRKLLLESEKNRVEVCFDMDSKLRGTTVERFKSYALSFGRWQTANEIRDKEGMPPIDGGDRLLEPMNMQAVNAILGGEDSSAASDAENEDQEKKN
jgi:HK97 family phage portal protein